jgi:hypothetical protein
MLLLLKLVLVPALIAAVTLAARRWGARVGGILGAFPLVAGPILFFLGVEQGDAFVAAAARAALVALVGVAAFSVAYAWVALRSRWPASVAAGWVAFALIGVPLQHVRWTAGSALAAALAGFLLGAWCLPAQPEAAPRPLAPAWDLPLRMGTAVTLVLVVTSMAAWMGPHLTGALTPFPVATAVLLAFTHHQEGAAGAVGYLRGFLPAMWSFALFCFVIAVAAPSLGHVAGFVLALAVQLTAHGAILWLLRGSSRAPIAPGPVSVPRP